MTLIAAISGVSAATEEAVAPLSVSCTDEPGATELPGAGAPADAPTEGGGIDTDGGISRVGVRVALGAATAGGVLGLKTTVARMTTTPTTRPAPITIGSQPGIPRRSRSCVFCGPEP